MKPPYNITEKIVALVASISEKIGEINATHLYKPATELRKKNRIKTIQSSLEIEGNTLTEEQITALIEKKSNNLISFSKKDGEPVPYDDDENSKHSLKKTGTKYVFSIKDPQPEDAGFYQLDVEDANVLATDFQGKVQLLLL